MLTESQVISAVCRYLKAKGFSIRQQHGETERGEDIIAVLPDGRSQAFIEAKGETSSKSHTARFGKPFSSAQARVHVAVAVYRAAQCVGTRTLSGVAFPKNAAHVAVVKKIEPALKRLRIEVFFVSPKLQVEVAGYWGNVG